MTIYIVEAGAGGANGTLPTLAAAAKLVQPGDEVRVRGGIYGEVLIIDTPNTIWRADDGHTPVIDGNYHEGLLQNGKLPHPDGKSYLPSGEWAGLAALRAEGTVIQGLTIRNSAGRGVTVGASGCTVRECDIYWCYDSCVSVSPPAGVAMLDGVLIEGNACTRASVRWYDPARGQFAPESVSGAIKMGQVRGGVIRGNRVSYGHGEGINVGKDNENALVEGNIVHTCNHVHLYNVRSRDVIFRDNIIYHLGAPPEFVGAGELLPAGIAVGDETGNNPEKWGCSSGGHIHHNLVVGLGVLLDVRNNASNYDTQLKGALIEHNTFVAGPGTRYGVRILANQQKRPHAGSRFEHNAIEFGGAPAGAEIARFGGQGVAFGGNAWSRTPPVNVASADDVVGALGLVAPDASLESFSIDHYRPRPLSPLISAGPDETTIGALAAGSSEPPPPPVDWARLVELAAGVGMQLSVMAEAGNAAQERMATMAEAHEAALDGMAALLAMMGEYQVE